MLPNREICGKPGRSVPTWVCGLPPDHPGPCALYDTEPRSKPVVFDRKPMDDTELVVGDIYLDYVRDDPYAWDGHHWIRQVLGA